MSLIGTEIDKLFVEKKTKPGPIGQIPIYNEVILCKQLCFFEHQICTRRSLKKIVFLIIF